VTEIGVFNQIPDGRLPHTGKRPTIIEHEIRRGLEREWSRSRALFDRVERIGVSAIGVTDPEHRLLTNIVRKPWKAPRKKQPLINFDALFRTSLSTGEALFPRVKDQNQITVLNDAQAACLLEHVYAFDDSKPPVSLLYLLVDEGINGAISYSGRAPHTGHNVEVGHCRPPLHEFDLAFDPTVTGCTSHVLCFEGLASDARVRQQWGSNFSALSDTNLKEALDIEAWYLGQLAMLGIQTLDPEAVRFGGEVFHGSNGLALIEGIRQMVLELNGGYLPHYRTRKDIKQLIQRGTYGRAVGVLSALHIAATGRGEMRSINR
jgi:predicted NBD/HSP70 family sugar kinase